MENIFVFHPVGQGLFYTGTLSDKVHFVYDCGTESSQGLLQEAIDRFACKIARNGESKPVLDFVVISHLHRDHISGLPYLFRKFNIRKLYLPYLGRGCFAQSYLAYTLLDGGRGIDDDRELFGFLMRLYSGEGYSQTEIEYLYNPYGEERGESYAEYSTLPFKFGFWKFYLINKSFSRSVIADLDMRIEQLLLSKNMIEILQYVEIYGYKEIEKIYKQVFCLSPKAGKRYSAKLNPTSTLLLHFPEEVYHTEYRVYNQSFTAQGQFPMTVTTLLTGDAEMDVSIDSRLRKILRYSHVDVLQIPHHGARANWELLKKFQYTAEFYVVPFGLGNRHHHPAGEVIDDLKAVGEYAHCATQQDTVEYIIVT